MEADQENAVAIEPNEVVQEVVEPQESESHEDREDTQVPLIALKKERKKRQEVEMELQYLRQQAEKQKAEEDMSRYESATREDLSHSQSETVRLVEERLWIKQNPEKFARINEELETFLKTKPHLAAAISGAPNRYEEAYTLMNALNRRAENTKPKESQKAAPGSPSTMPKAAAMDHAVDVMTMSDKEFRDWRQSIKRR